MDTSADRNKTYGAALTSPLYIILVAVAYVTPANLSSNHSLHSAESLPTIRDILLSRHSTIPFFHISFPQHRTWLSALLLPLPGCRARCGAHNRPDHRLSHGYQTLGIRGSCTPGEATCALSLRASEKSRVTKKKSMSMCVRRRICIHVHMNAYKCTH